MPEQLKINKVKPELIGVAPTLRPNLENIIHRLIPSVDRDSPIGQKWQSVGGQDRLGKAIEFPESTPDGKGSYQQFERGVIFHTSTYGATLISNPIFDKWMSLSKGQQRYLGFPVKDSFQPAPRNEAAYFEKGAIVARANGKAYWMRGELYARYRDLGGVDGFLGLPVSDEERTAKGGRRVRFDKGDLYWHNDIGARTIYGAIRNRWQALGGAGGFLGLPLTDELPVMKDGKEIGRFNRFQGGTIYWSPRTGAWDVYGDIRKTWEDEYGGATGRLGFPTSGETSTPHSGGRFNNFEEGILVWHPRGTYRGTHALFSLEFFMDRFGSKGSDGLGGAQDVYVKVDVHASTGQRYKRRMPNSGDYGADEEIDRVFIRVPVVQSDLVVNVRLEGWDSDKGRPFDNNDRLGTVRERYTIDNLWGLFEDATHWRNNFLAVYKFRNPMPLDPSKGFREQLFWSFRNFSTNELSTKQYAQTFRDVAELDFNPWNPSTWRPFDRAFYETVYKAMASGGNCFGMALESVYAQVGRSIYSQPIYRFSRDREAVNEINIKHGYQLAGGLIDWFLGKFIAGHTHNPVRAFHESREAFRRGDYPVMVITSGYFNIGGHVVRPYEWEQRDSERWIIKIADPNVPYGRIANDTHPRCRIDVNPKDNTFRYQFGNDEVWTGGEWSGGRMYAIPFSQLSYHPRTPFWEVLALLTSGTLILLGDGQTQQMTDERGKTFYEPNASGVPTQWQQIRRDRRSRIPRMARLPLLNYGQPLPELHYLQGGATKSLQQEVSAESGQSYQWAMRSALLSAAATVSGRRGGSDTMRVEQLDTSNPALSLTTAEAGAAKTVTLSLSGDIEGTKQFELHNLSIQPGQALNVRVAEAGEELLLENNGPEANFELQVRSPGDRRVARPRVTLEAGKAARLRPADWTPGAADNVPVRMDILDDLRGPVRRRINL
jgi:hypothetical protein